MDICQAFKNAKIVVQISHGVKEADIFQLLIFEEKDRNTNEVKTHICDISPFGEFKQGQFKLDKK